MTGTRVNQWRFLCRPSLHVSRELHDGPADNSGDAEKPFARQEPPSRDGTRTHPSSTPTELNNSVRNKPLYTAQRWAGLLGKAAERGDESFRTGLYINVQVLTCAVLLYMLHVTCTMDHRTTPVMRKSRSRGKCHPREIEQGRLRRPRPKS